MSVLPQYSNRVAEHMKWFEESILSLDGFFYRGDALAIALLDEAQRKKQISGDWLELGVYKGKSYCYLSGMLDKSEKLIGFDGFGKVYGKEYLDECIDNLKNAGRNQDRCILYKGNTRSIPAYAIFDNDLRFVHIDADHEHSGVLADLCSVQPFIKRGGILCLDDLPIREFPGIWSALCEFIYLKNGKDLRPFLITKNKMYLSHYEYYLYYRDCCAQHFNNVNYRQVFDVSVAVTDGNGISKREKSQEFIRVFPD